MDKAWDIQGRGERTANKYTARPPSGHGPGSSVSRTFIDVLPVHFVCQAGYCGERGRTVYFETGAGWMMRGVSHEGYDKYSHSMARYGLTPCLFSDGEPAL